MWKLIAVVSIITQLSTFAAVITPNNEVALTCDPAEPDYMFAYIDCNLIDVKSPKDQVHVASTNFDVGNEKFTDITIRLRIYGNAKYPEHFPKNLGKLVSGVDNFYYKKTPLKYIKRDDFKDFGVKLTSLSLGENEIIDIPFDTFYDLPNLRDLILRSNRITNLSPNLFDNSPNFGLLFADFNQITEVHPDLFKNNPFIRVITMRHNKIKNVPFDFTKFDNLASVDFTHNAGTCDTMYFRYDPFVEYYDDNDLKKWIKDVKDFQKKIEETCRG